jgi:hypothetical protein
VTVVLSLLKDAACLVFGAIGLGVVAGLAVGTAVKVLRWVLD